MKEYMAMSHGGEVPKPTGYDQLALYGQDGATNVAGQLEFDLSERSPDPSKPYYQPTVFPDLPPPPHPVYEPPLAKKTNGVNREIDKATDPEGWLAAKLNERFEEIRGKKATEAHLEDLRRQRGRQSEAEELKVLLAGPNYNDRKTMPAQPSDQPSLAELPSDEAALEAARTQVRDLLNALIAQREAFAAQTAPVVESAQQPQVSDPETMAIPSIDPVPEDMTTKYAVMSLDSLAALQAEAYFHGDADKHRAINDSLANRIYDREQFLKKYTDTLATYRNTSKPPVLEAEEAAEPAVTAVTPEVLKELPPPPAPRRRRQHPRVDWSHRTGQSAPAATEPHPRIEQPQMANVDAGVLVAGLVARENEGANSKESTHVVQETQLASKPRLFDRIRGRAVMAVTPDMTRESLQSSKENDSDKRDRNWTKRVAGGVALVAAGVAIWLLKDGVDVGKPNMPNLPNWLDFGDDNKPDSNASPQPGPRPSPDAVPTVPDRPRGGGNVAEPMQFSRAARTVQPGEGFYQTFQDLKIPRDQWPELLQKVGPKLEKNGDAYRMPNGDWGISHIGQLSQKSLELIAKTRRQ